ncbi:MAG: GMP synthase [Gammaproteobacteria bacterium RIFCSPHIGHO2_12_FULL_43_28]|nr:MAG: GMP synthase [Gammaproteobacteria bacterium RIFCSPHIGHO2_12_FULL_43_28]
MKILLVTHATFEQPGSIKTWAEHNGHLIEEVKPYAGETLPEIIPFDMVVMMGGPQSPLTIENTPYLNDEIEMLKIALKKNKKIIGVCLGAQLIAEALGAKTERSPNREIGSYSLTLLEDAKCDPVFSQYDSTIDVMHWHSDMPGIPKGAKLIAKSEGCPRQIFRYGDRVYGFQCHFELTKKLVDGMIRHCKHDLKNGDFVMTEKELANVDYDEINSKMDAVLDYLSQLN